MREKIIRQKIEEIFPKVVAFRRELHMYPELSEAEDRTSARICEELEKLGIPFTTTPQRAVIATIEGRGEGPAGKYKGLGIRADFDALPIQEQTGFEYSSKNPGVMHACGHDIHTAMLLGTGMILNEMRDSFVGAVKLFFQPAEETVGGAKDMIEAGCMENPEIDSVIALHVAPDVKSGRMQFCPGKMNAATASLYIDVEGVSCHGAHPEEGVDALLAAANIVTALQAVVARNLAPTEPGVVTVGTFNSGQKDNVIAGSAKLTGTLRALDMDTMAKIKKHVKTTAEGIASAYGAKATVRMIDSYPTLENDIELGKVMESLAKELFGEENVEYMAAPSLGADDFAFFTQYCDGVYMNLGTTTGREAHPQMLHNEFFSPDEEAMKTGILMETMAAFKLLGGE
ncbi:MAG: amidohydrolase [Clostridiales bacterium]|nr:amidohydrolase [Clostridiales bacterium]